VITAYSFGASTAAGAKDNRGGFIARLGPVNIHSSILKEYIARIGHQSWSWWRYNA